MKSSSPVSWKRTSPVSWSGRIGKNGGRIISANTSPRGPSSWRGRTRRGSRTVDVEWREERQALHVIPVEVRQQHRPVEHAVATVGVGTEPGAEIEEDRRRIVGLERNRRGMATEVRVLGAGAGRRSSDPVEDDSHPPGHRREDTHALWILNNAAGVRRVAALSRHGRTLTRRREPRWRSTHSPRVPISNPTATSSSPRADQGLRRSRRSAPGGREPQPARAPGRDLRTFGTERRGQDDDCRHADDT